MGKTDFWNDIYNGCKQHVEKMISIFKTQNNPRFDWAEQRFKVLIKKDTLMKLISTAKESYSKKNIFSLLVKKSIQSAIEPIFVDKSNSWYIVVSVFPTAVDHDFINACPESSYETFALRNRERFRNDVEHWVGLDYAHWILLVFEEFQQASIHLHTIWNFAQVLDWLSSAKKANAKPILAPFIVPVDLMREDIISFTQKIVNKDTVASLIKYGTGTFK